MREVVDVRDTKKKYLSIIKRAKKKYYEEWVKEMLLQKNEKGL